MKRILLLIIGATLTITLAQAQSTKDTLKVVSYNIRNGEANDGTNSWNFRYPATILMLEDQMPDIFGLQEAYSYQVKFIEENMKDYKTYGLGREDGKKEGEFMSIFYNTKKIKMGKRGTFWLSQTPKKPSMGWDAACRRTATWAFMKMKKSGKEFIYVNTHLDHVGKEARKEGLTLIVDYIAKLNTKNLPVVLTGDFNVTPDDPCLESLEGKMISVRDEATSTDRHATYNEWGRANKVIDYIYQSGFDSMPLFKTLTKRYGQWKYISDHYPVSALLVF